MNYASFWNLILLVVSGTPTIFEESWSNLAGHKGQCEDKGMRLCTYDELCPDGDGGTPAVGKLNSDQHVVIQADSSFHQAENCEYEDIQIGSYPNPPVCKGYFRHFQGQGHCTSSSWWGNTLETHSYQARVVCCDTSDASSAIAPPEEMTLFYQPWSHVSGAKATCEAKGMQLCTYDEICPDGENANPAIGKLNYNQNVAIRSDSSFNGNEDGKYESIQIGTGPILCTRYCEHWADKGYCTRSNWWGIVETSSASHQATTLCCPIPLTACENQDASTKFLDRLNEVYCLCDEFRATGYQQDDAPLSAKFVSKIEALRDMDTSVASGARFLSRWNNRLQMKVKHHDEADENQANKYFHKRMWRKVCRVANWRRNQMMQWAQRLDEMTETSMNS